MTRKLNRTYTVALALAGAAICNAQEVVGIRVNLGYHWTQGFELRDGSSGDLTGPELGVDFPLFSFAGIQLDASPSVVFGGKLSLGGEVEGQLYRFLATGRKTLTNDGLYVVGGAGFGHSEARGDQEFKSSSGFVGCIALGTPLRFNLFGVSPNVEGRYYFSNEDQFRGFTIGLSARF